MVVNDEAVKGLMGVNHATAFCLQIPLQLLWIMFEILAPILELVNAGAVRPDKERPSLLLDRLAARSAP